MYDALDPIVTAGIFLIFSLNHMDTLECFNIVACYFQEKSMDYAVVGAFALHAYGYTRNTKDIDFITRCEYQDKIIGHLESKGFKTVHKSSGYSNHLHQDESRVDFVYVDGDTAEEIFRETQKKAVLEGLELPVVSIEHLVALKLFAIKNQPHRKLKDLADIREMIQRTRPDMVKIKSYFEKYGLAGYYNEVTGKE